MKVFLGIISCTVGIHTDNLFLGATCMVVAILLILKSK
jgi:hypothetical protein